MRKIKRKKLTPTPQDRARKAAKQIANNFAALDVLSTGVVQGSTTTPKKSTGKKAGELLGGLVKGFVNTDSTAGKGDIKSVLTGLSEAYISECVRKYRAGENMTEFERQVAKAAISAESTIKDRIKSRAVEWVIDHAFEIGIGLLVLILLILYMRKK